MCTVSWAARPDADGYDLYFNRDERRTRGPERPPAHEEQGGVRYLAPADGDAGGTWLAVNEFGLTVCLLNGYVETRGAAPPAWRSRGLLVRDLAGAEDVATLDTHLARVDLTAHRPFVLLAVSPCARARTLHWDGLELIADDDPPRPIASSGHDQAVAQLARAARYAELARERGVEDRALLERFLADHDAAPSAYTACMHRDDAETRSQCRVRVRADRVELVHVPGAPCRTAPGPTHALPRRLPLPAPEGS